MKEELDQFKKNNVWTLVPKYENTSIIADEKVIRNKVNLIAQSYSQYDGVDYDENFVPIIRLGSL